MIRTLLCLAAVAVSGWLMSWSLDRGMTADEFFSFHLAQMGEFYRWIFHQNHPPLYWVALKYWSNHSFDEAWLRTLSIPFGMTTVWGVGLLAGLWDARSRVPATWMAAVFPAFLRWGSEIRMYSFFLAFAVMGLWLGIRAVRTQRSLVPAAIVLALASLSHSLGLVWVAATGAALFRMGWRPRTEAMAGWAALGLAIAMIHILPFLSKWWWTPSASELGEQLRFFLGYYLFPPWLTALVLAGAAVGLLRCRAAPLGWAALVYGGGLIGVSLVGPNVLLARAFLPLYLLAIPAFCIGWNRFPRQAWALPLVVGLLWAGEWRQRAALPIEPIKTLTASVREEFQPGDRWLTLSPWMHRIGVGVRYGGVRPAQRIRGPVDPADLKRVTEEIELWRTLHPKGRLHVLFSFRDSEFAVQWAVARFRLHREKERRVSGLAWWLVRSPQQGASPSGPT